MAGKSRNPRDANFLYKNADNLFGVGTAFPGSPALNDRFFRTDLGWLCYYDGTRWLTENEFSFFYSLINVATVNSAAIRLRGGTVYAPYFTYFSMYTYVFTTNDASNYWSFALKCGNLDTSTEITMATPDTHLDTVATFTDHSASVNTAPAQTLTFRYKATATGAPGNYSLSFTIAYRLIMT
jgi:hypothetical protein